MACLLDFGVMDDDCEQQVPSVALVFITVDNTSPMVCVYNS